MIFYSFGVNGRRDSNLRKDLALKGDDVGVVFDVRSEIHSERIGHEESIPYVCPDIWQITLRVTLSDICGPPVEIQMVKKSHSIFFGVPSQDSVV